MAASASLHGCISAIASCIPCSSSKFSSQSSLTLSAPQRASTRRSFRVCRAMVQQAVQGAPAAYAKEMERLSAKESLLLAVRLLCLRIFPICVSGTYQFAFGPLFCLFFCKEKNLLLF